MSKSRLGGNALHGGHGVMGWVGFPATPLSVLETDDAMPRVDANCGKKTI